MSESPPDIKSLFADTLEKRTPAERDAYLGLACQGDTALRQRVEALLRAYEEAHDVPDAPLVSLGLLEPGAVLTEGPGTVIGRYKLLEKIGEGGMAVVYVAEQTELIRRTVALKIIKLGMDTRQVIARFEAERQALALMDHPSIAKVLDAGATETGRPYFVMELVQGVSITAYCDKNNLSTKERLSLFLQVCHAVQHAHQKGIIHRDIKPSNVMVTHRDDKPVPKVIDFGIAKATNQRLTEKTLFTRYAHLIGTPAYMSPEQAALSGLDIDTRSDIYSLGVLLYELLTGTTPFSEEELCMAGYVEMQRIIREQEPVKPSTRIRAAARERQCVGAGPRACPRPRSGPSGRGGGHRGAPLREVHGDLDWIVMKSLEKDRAGRYETAEDLALDIQRHLEHRPVSARAPSRAYRLHRFLRRYRLPVAGGLALALLIGALAVVLSWWNQNRLRLIEDEVVKHRDALSRARTESTKLAYGEALKTLEPVLGSRHVGTEARLLRDQILQAVRGRIADYTREIEADPQKAAAYSHRAQHYAHLGDRANADADMRRWSAVMARDMPSRVQIAALGVFRGVTELPFDCQIVFSVERPVNEIPTMSVAFGQKGRWEMKLFEIPVFLVSLAGFGLLSGLDAPPAYADFAFGEKVNLELTVPILNGEIECVDCLSYDGLEMYIESMVGPGNWDIRVLRRASIDEVWSPPQSLGPAVNTANVEACSCISADGLALYFNSNRPGGYGGSDLYMTMRATKNDLWGSPVNLGPKVNSSKEDAYPWISADGLELYLSSKRAGGYGDWDLWVAKRATKDAAWGDPVNLGPAVNSPYTETALSLSPDGLRLVFSDYFLTNLLRPGGYGSNDIWISGRASPSGPWQAAMNLGPKINTAEGESTARFSPDGRTLYFCTSVDNWQVPIIPIVDFNADGTVDLVDLVMLIDDWGTNRTLCDIGPMPWGDGKVDIEDLKVFMTYYEKANPPAKP
jgi:serine/threonine protein kinase